MNRFYILIFLIFFLSGCTAITGHGELLNSFEKTVEKSSCDYSFVEKRVEKKDDIILWASQGGILSRDCFDYKKSNYMFDQAENIYKSDVDLQSNFSKTRSKTSSILINKNINEYTGNEYEKIMLNTYKGLNSMALNDFEDARVEFNRALDRQRRAKEYFQKDIIKAQNRSKEDKNYQKAQNKQTQKAIYDNYEDIFSGFEEYSDFVNPYATYISSLFFLLDKDFSKSRDLLKESLAMQPTNKQIKKDFELLDELMGYSKNDKNYAWIIYENGQSMVKKEISMSIPLFLFTNDLYYTTLALPTLYERDSSYEYIQVENQKSVIIANMDSVIKAEFKKRFPQIALEATLNSIVKTYLQYELNQQSPIGGFLGAFYQGLTNKADIRSWTTLPKNFQSLRVELNHEPIIIKDDKNRVISTLLVDNNTHVLIYIKSSSRGNVKVHKIIKGRR
ncbi:MAG: hypothetical protein JJV95_04770 [Sulfurospirillum sp.]|nr:hypothetical protein [Sulfurospirillum sp.]MBL0703276.1 hypothetical protein [Sulfurospirillum sp.]